MEGEHSCVSFSHTCLPEKPGTSGEKERKRMRSEQNDSCSRVSQVEVEEAQMVALQSTTVDNGSSGRAERNEE